MSTGNILQIAGMAIGSYFGPIGAAIGGAIGGAIGASMVKLPVQYGPRLSDRAVQVSSYGAAVPQLFGADRVAGNITWVQNNELEEVVTTTVTEQDGKGGGPSQTTITYSYYATFQLLVGDPGPNGLRSYRRIWADAVLVYDASPFAQYPDLEAVFYRGGPGQLPDPTMEASLGAGNVPGNLGHAHIVFNRMPLGLFGNRIPNITVEYVGDGDWGVADTEQLGAVNPVGYNMTTVQADDGTLIGAGTSFTFGGNLVLNRYSADGVLLESVETVSDHAPGSNSVYVSGINEVWVPLTGIGNGFRRVSASSLTALEAYTDPLDGLYHAGGSFHDERQHVVIAKLGISLFWGFYMVAYSDGSDGETPGTIVKLGMNGFAANFLVGGGREICVGWIKGNALWYAFDVQKDRNLGYTTTSSATGSTSEAVYDPVRRRYVCLGEDRILTIDDSLTALFVTQAVDPAYLPGIITGARFLGGLDAIAVTSTWITTTKVTVIDAATFTVLADEFIGPVGTYGVSSGGALSSTSAPGELTFGGAVQPWRYNVFRTTYAEAVRRLATKSGELTAGDVDVTDLGITLRGFTVGQQTKAREAIDQLLQSINADCVEQDDKLVFKRRGGASVATITASECAAASEQAAQHAIVWTRVDEVNLPAELTVTGKDPARDYQSGTQYGARVVGLSGDVQAFQSAVVLSSNEQIRLAASKLFSSWAERNNAAWSTTRKHSRLVPTDVITLDGRRVRITEKDDQSSVVNWRGVTDDADTFNQTMLAVNGVFPRRTVHKVQPTTWGLLDGPLLRDADDTPGSYIWFTGYGDGWDGGVLLASDNAGETWVREATLPRPGSSIGTATSALGNFTRGNLFDDTNALSVIFSTSAESPSSASRAAVRGGANAMALYGANGWEVLQYRTATLELDGSYTLTGLLRGRRGTGHAVAGHAIGDRAVLLSTSGIRTMAFESTLIGVPRDYRAVSIGADLDSTGNRVLTVEAERLKPFAPVGLRALRDVATGDITLTWRRRTRYAHRFLAVGVVPPVGEVTELYTATVWTDSSYAVVKRVLPTATSPTASYTSAQQVTDFGTNQATIYVTVTQTSAVVGAGHELRKAA